MMIYELMRIIRIISIKKVMIIKHEYINNKNNSTTINKFGTKKHNKAHHKHFYDNNDDNNSQNNNQ